MVIDPRSQILEIRYKDDIVHNVNVHVVVFLTAMASAFAVSCDGCTPPPPGPDGGVDVPDAGDVPPPSIIALNEVMSRNDTTHRDSFNEFDDWLELYNLTDAAVDLAGFTLADSGNTPSEFPPGATILANDVLVVFLDDAPAQGSAAEPHFPFKLAGEGDTLFLRDGDTVVDVFTIPELPIDISYGRLPDGEGDPQLLDEPTPDALNTGGNEGEGEGEGEQNCTSTVLMNEVLAENTDAATGLRDGADELEPWVELYNAADAPAPLAGLTIGLSAAQTGAPLPDLVLEGGTFLIVFLDGEPKDGSEPHLSLAITGAATQLVLKDECGDVVQTLSLAGDGPNASVSLVDHDPETTTVGPPTPGS